jgi:hypothetical protein
MYMYVYIQTSIPSLPILLEYAKDTQRTIVDIMDERERLLHSQCVCIEDVTGGLESSRKRGKTNKKKTGRRKSSLGYMCVYIHFEGR